MHTTGNSRLLPTAPLQPVLLRGSCWPACVSHSAANAALSLHDAYMTCFRPYFRSMGHTECTASYSFLTGLLAPLVPFVCFGPYDFL